MINSNTNISNRILHFFLTSRPYSYINEVSRGIIFGLLIYPIINQNGIVEIGVLSMLVWVYFNWQSDWIQKDKGRLRPTVLLCYSPLILTISYCLYSKHFFGILGVIIYVFTILLYSLKANNRFLGKYAFLLRMFSVSGHLMMIVFFLEQIPQKESVGLIFVLTLIKGISNFVGDIRDVRTDKYEFPAKYGIPLSYKLLRFLFIISLLFSFIINQQVVFVCTFSVLIIQWGIFEVLTKKYPKSPYIVGYIYHRFLVLTTSIYQTLLLLYFGVNLYFVFILIIVMVITQFSYIKIPGKNYEKIFKQKNK